MAHDIKEKINAFLNENNKDIIEYRLAHPNSNELSDHEILIELQKQDIKNNTLPNYIKQHWKICQENGPWQKKYLHVIEKFLSNIENKTFLDENIFGDLRKAQIYLSDDFRMNACVIKGTKPPIFIFSKGVFMDEYGHARPVDFFAHILGHELSHPSVTESLKSKNSSSFQETLCDINGYDLAQRAGYSSEPLYQYWSKIKTPTSIGERISDVHPVGGDRRIALDLQSAKSDLIGRGIIPLSNESFSTNELEAISNAKGMDFLSNLFKSIDYNNLDDETKAEAFFDIFSYLIEQRPDIVNDSYLFLDDKMNLIKAHNNSLASQILKLNLSEKTIKKLNKHSLFNFLRYKSPFAEEVNRRYNLKSILTSNQDANNHDKIIYIAYLMNEYHNIYLEKNPSLSDFCLSAFNINDNNLLEPFEYQIKETLKKGEHYNLPWKTFFEYLNKTKNDNDKQELQNLLKILNIEEHIKKLQENYTINEHYEITGLNDTQYRFCKTNRSKESCIEIEKNILKNEANNIHQRVDEINWELLETSPNEFFEKHKNQLVPRFTLIELIDQVKDDPISEKLTQEFERLLKKDPEKFVPIVYKFYTNILPDAISKYKKETTPPNIGIISQWANTVKIHPRNPHIAFLEKNATNIATKKFSHPNHLLRIFQETLLSKEYPTDYSKPYEDIFNINYYKLYNLKTPEDVLEFYQNGLFINYDFQQFLTRKFIKEIDITQYKNKLIPLDNYKFSNSGYLTSEKITNETNNIMENIAKHNMQILTQLNLDNIEEFEICVNEYLRLHNVTGYNINNKDTGKVHNYPLADSDYELNYQIENKIIQAITTLLKNKENNNQVFNLSSKILKHCPPKNIKFKEFLINTVATIHAQRIGKEIDCPSSFFHILNPNKFKEDFTDQIAYDILSKVLDLTETQEETTFKVESLFKKDLSLETEAAREIFHALYDCKDNLNLDLVDFLTKPVSEKTTAKLYQQIKEKANNTHNIILAKIMNIFPVVDINVHNIPEHVKQIQLAHFHQAFWNQSKEIQTILLNYLLFNYDESYMYGKQNSADPLNRENLDKSFQKIKNKLIKNNPNKKFFDIALDTFYNQSESNQTRGFIIALLYTFEPPKIVPYYTEIENSTEKDRPPIRPGEMLVTLASLFGAAGGKTLQAIHSHPSTPKDIKEDIKNSKSNFTPPTRFEIFKRLRAIVQENPKFISQNRYIGKLLGSGSFGYTVESKQTPDSPETYALTLLHPEVATIAKDKFKRFLTPIANALQQEDPKSFATIPAIVKHAQHLTDIESDFIIAGKQIKLANKMYNGIKIHVDGYNFKTQSAKLVSNDIYHKKTTLASGEHFNDLPCSTEKEKAYKKAVAQAIFTTELYILLQMGPIDSDRHGAQVRIDGDNITMFDHGAIDFIRHIGTEKGSHTIKYKPQPVLPTNNDKQIIGRIIGQTLSFAHQGADFAKTFETLLSREIAKESKNNKNTDLPPFINTFSRAVLALNDYIQSMGDTPKERAKHVQECLSAIINNKENLDLTLLRAIKDNTPPQILKETQKKTGKTPIKLKDTKKQFTGFFKKIALSIFQFINKDKELTPVARPNNIIQMPLDKKQKKILAHKKEQEDKQAQAENKNNQNQNNTKMLNEYIKNIGGR